MFLNIRHKQNKNSVAIQADACRINNNCSGLSLKKIFIATAIFIFLLAQSKIILAEDVTNVEYPVDSIGNIERTTRVIEDVSVTNINGVKYELMEERDEINHLLAHPDIIKDNDIIEAVTAKESPIAKKDATSKTQKKENVASKKIISKPKKIASKPAVKQKVAQKVKLQPIDITAAKKEETHTIASVEHKPVYNKHDINGKLLDKNIERWSCIHDTQNDLMWEVKSKIDDMRNPHNLYTWFKPENHVSSGIPDGGRCEGGTACDTNAYIVAMNEQNFCGYNDWQLPTREQMQTLVDLKNNDESVKINKDYFPETVASWYWTASENHDNNGFAWYVLFRNGVALSDLKERPKHIRLVRDTTQQVARY